MAFNKKINNELIINIFLMHGITDIIIMIDKYENVGEKGGVVKIAARFTPHFVPSFPHLSS